MDAVQTVLDILSRCKEACTRHPRWRAIWISALAVTTALGSAAGMAAAGRGIPISVHAASGPLVCDPNSIFNLDTQGRIYALTKTGAVNQQVGAFGNPSNVTVNGLGVAPNATAAYAVRQSGGGQVGGSTIYKVDGATGGTSQFTVAGNAAVSFVMGAVDPRSGIYYYGGATGSGADRALSIYAFDPNTSVGLGQVARVPLDNTDFGSGDFAFDLAGNLYIVISTSFTGRTNTVSLWEVNGPLPTTTPATTLGYRMLTTFTTASGIVYNGIAFGANGLIYAQAGTSTPTATLDARNPNNGELEPPTGTQTQTLAPGSTQPVDLASCSFPGTLTVAKNLTRAGANDQFTMTISQGAVQLATATTAGTTNGPQADRAGPIPGLPGTVYTISESLAQGTGTNISAYSSSWACVETNTGAPLISGSGRTFNLTFPNVTNANQGANVVCTFTNSPVAPSLTLTKRLGGHGRISNNDQFTVQIHDHTGEAVGIGNATTAGAGAEVVNGTGTLTVSQAIANTTYTLSEAMAAGSQSTLDNYQQIIHCTDLNHVQTGLPDMKFTASTQSIPVTPMPGANIDCVITNAPPEPVIGLSKELGTNRVRNTDQFRVAIRVGNPNGTELTPEPNANPITDGTGSEVLPDTGTTGFPTSVPGTQYFLTETPAGNPAANLSLYSGTVTCKDYNGVQPPATLPTNAPLIPAPSVTPVPGSIISCTITNNAVQPTLKLSKGLLAGARVNDNDQFTVEILRDQSMVLAASTTAGSGAVIAFGTGTAQISATAGNTYFLDEVPAGTTNPLQYSRVVSCSDANGVQAGLPTNNQPFEGFFPVMPQLGAAISCTVTNTPIPPTLQLSKALGSDRVRPGDQFAVQIRTGGPAGTVVSDQTNATTAGSGSTVETGTGTTGPFTATAGTEYFLTESAVGTTVLTDYSSVITCTDSQEPPLQTGLPEGVPFTGSLGITPVAAASIECTITNTAKAAPSPSPSPSPSGTPTPSPTTRPTPGLPKTGFGSPPPGMAGAGLIALAALLLLPLGVLGRWGLRRSRRDQG